ncbi:LOW QUALITY PROTEIN: hypothetical protein HID58_088606 [Brassica napus]|uniref:SNF2 domain-containing protein CLASSY 2 n=1 Tax=Brassica napus TaxID=3708 RepID=A0ABQ7XWM6_BRANA|nr:LOW QUALITY PROTEIN: hypothetical protein HID58_088606 [Brassica napus]
MKRRRFYDLKHPFDPFPFEIFSCGTWNPVEYIRIQHGKMTVPLLENGYILEDIRPFQRLRLRSRKATLNDCTCFLRPGIDVCVLYPLHEDDLEPVWIDARIVSIERKPHESECTCEIYVKIYIDQGCIGMEGQRINRDSVIIGLNQISILQKFYKEQSGDQFYRWKFSEDCTTLMKTRLSLGNFLPDLSWLLVTSVMKNIVFHVRTVQNKMVYEIVTDEASSSSLSSMNITVEDGVSLSKVVMFNPADIVDLEVNQETELYSEEDDVVELRRSKRRVMRPDRYTGCDYQLDTNDGWVRMMPYRFEKLDVVSMEDEYYYYEEEDSGHEEDDDTQNDLFKIKRSKSLRLKPKRRQGQIVMVEKKRRRGPGVKQRKSLQVIPKRRQGQIVMIDKKRGRELGRKEKFGLTVIPFTPVFDPIPLEQFGLNANSLDQGGGFSRNQYFDDIENYRSKSAKFGKKATEMEEMMESDLCWKGPNHVVKSVQTRVTRSSSRSAAQKNKCSDEPKVYKKVTLSAGAYNKLIDAYMSNIDSTIASLNEPASVVDQWEELKKTNFASKPHGWEMGGASSEDGEGETSENDMLWREMELCLASSYILDDNEVRVDNEAFEKAKSGCEHEYMLDEEIGMCCRLCGHVGSEIKHVSAPFIEEDDIKTKLSHKKSTSKDFTMSNDSPEMLTAEESDNVWALIPHLKRKLHMHQRRAFEFLWRNLAGSVEPPLMDPTSDNIGGCVISHAPGAGKTFLMIAFLTSYLKLFPETFGSCSKNNSLHVVQGVHQREIPVPVHLIHGRRTYCVFKKNSVVNFNRVPKPSQDVMHVLDCLEKIQKWHAHPSVLVMGYTSFLTLMREDSKFAHRKYMAKVLRESPGLLILDEGHNPRSTKSRLRKGLMKVGTDLRILLSGTLFQNNFCEYFNTLCLARPKFVHEVLMELDKKFKANQGVNKAPHLLENRARKFFLDNIAKKIDAGVGDERLQGLNMLRNMTTSFIDNYEGSGGGDALPGLQIYTLLMNSTDIQHKILTKLGNVMASYHGFLLELELLVTLAAIHPWLVKTSACCAKFLNAQELLEIERLKHDAKKGSKVMFVLNLVFRVVKREKILIFCHNIAPIRLFIELFESIFRWQRGREILTLTGDQELFERGRVIDKFEEPGNPSRVLLASITACAEGISLTAASRVIMLDSEWNPSKTKQAIARAFRPGQQKVVYRNVGGRQVQEDDVKEWVSSMIFSEDFVEDPSLWQAEKIEDDVLREIVGEDRVKSFHMIMKNEKASTG